MATQSFSGSTHGGPPPCVLERLDASIEISEGVAGQDPRAAVTLSAHFANHDTVPVEGNFKCPIDTQAAVTKAELKVADRTTVAKAKSKSDADDHFDDAVSSGKRSLHIDGASLASEGVLDLSVGMLPPGERLSATVTYCVDLPVDHVTDAGFVHRLIVPLVGGSAAPPSGAQGTLSASPDVYSVCARAFPSGQFSDYAAFSSPTHNMEFARDKSTMFAPDRDLVVHCTIPRSGRGAAVSTHATVPEEYRHAFAVPLPDTLPSKPVDALKVAVLLDCGPEASSLAVLEEGKRFAKEFVRELPKGASVAVRCFGDASKVPLEPLRDTAAREAVLRRVNHLKEGSRKAALSSKRLAAELASAKREYGADTDVLVVTPGQSASSRGELTAASAASGLTVHSVSVGHASGRGLVEAVSYSGGGVFTHVAPRERVRFKAAEFVRAMQAALPPVAQRGITTSTPGVMLCPEGPVSGKRDNMIRGFAAAGVASVSLECKELGWCHTFPIGDAPLIGDLHTGVAANRLRNMGAGDEMKRLAEAFDLPSPKTSLVATDSAVHTGSVAGLAAREVIAPRAAPLVAPRGIAGIRVPAAGDSRAQGVPQQRSPPLETLSRMDQSQGMSLPFLLGSLSFFRSASQDSGHQQHDPDDPCLQSEQMSECRSMESDSDGGAPEALQQMENKRKSSWFGGLFASQDKKEARAQDDDNKKKKKRSLPSQQNRSKESAKQMAAPQEQTWFSALGATQPPQQSKQTSQDSQPARSAPRPSQGYTSPSRSSLQTTALPLVVPMVSAVQESRAELLQQVFVEERFEEVDGMLASELCDSLSVQLESDDVVTSVDRLQPAAPPRQEQARLQLQEPPGEQDRFQQPMHRQEEEEEARLQEPPGDQSQSQQQMHRQEQAQLQQPPGEQPQSRFQQPMHRQEKEEARLQESPGEQPRFQTSRPQEPPGEESRFQQMHRQAQAQLQEPPGGMPQSQPKRRQKKALQLQQPTGVQSQSPQHRHRQEHAQLQEPPGEQARLQQPTHRQEQVQLQQPPGEQPQSQSQTSRLQEAPGDHSRFQQPTHRQEQAQLQEPPGKPQYQPKRRQEEARPQEPPGGQSQSQQPMHRQEQAQSQEPPGKQSRFQQPTHRQEEARLQQPPGEQPRSQTSRPQGPPGEQTRFQQPMRRQELARLQEPPGDQSQAQPKRQSELQQPTGKPRTQKEAFRGGLEKRKEAEPSRKGLSKKESLQTKDTRAPTARKTRAEASPPKAFKAAKGGKAETSPLPTQAVLRGKVPLVGELLQKAIAEIAQNPTAAAAYYRLAMLLSDTQTVTLLSGETLGKAGLLKRAIALAPSDAKLGSALYCALSSCLGGQAETTLEDGTVHTRQSLQEAAACLASA